MCQLPLMKVTFLIPPQIWDLTLALCFWECYSIEIDQPELTVGICGPRREEDSSRFPRQSKMFNRCWRMAATGSGYPVLDDFIVWDYIGNKNEKNSGSGRQCS